MSTPTAPNQTAPTVHEFRTAAKVLRHMRSSMQQESDSRPWASWLWNWFDDQVVLNFLLGTEEYLNEKAALSANDSTTLGGSPASVKFLAREIAHALFTSGDGMHAARLSFVLPDQREYGGWSEAAAATLIEGVIARRLSEKPAGDGR